MRRLLAHLIAPKSFCSSCGRPFWTDRRTACVCGETARTFSRMVKERPKHKDKAKAS